MSDSNKNPKSRSGIASSLAGDIKPLIDLLKGTDVTELEIENGDFKVSIKRGMAIRHEAAPTPISYMPFTTETMEAQTEEVAANLLKVTAPMVGTFYRSASPGEPPLVREGDVIEKGHVIGIIEAMKMMNEIESDHSGRVLDFLVDDGHPVEYGQPLLLLEPVEE